MCRDMEEKLQGIEERFEEINRELAQVGEDYQRAAELGRERAELEPIVESYRRFRALSDQREQAQLLLDSDDDELRSTFARGLKIHDENVKTMFELTPKDELFEGRTV